MSLPSSAFTMSCWLLEIGHGGSIYTMELCKPGLLFSLFGKLVVKIYRYTTARPPLSLVALLCCFGVSWSE